MKEDITAKRIELNRNHDALDVVVYVEDPDEDFLTEIELHITGKGKPVIIVSNINDEIQEFNITHEGIERREMV